MKQSLPQTVSVLQPVSVLFLSTPLDAAGSHVASYQSALVRMGVPRGEWLDGQS